jgi:hypothetical protein
MIRKYKLIGIIIWINFSVSAQDVITSFLEKHRKDDNLEVVSIGKKMIETLCDLSSDNPELKDAIEGLENIRIVTSKDRELDKEYYNSARELASKCKEMEEYFSVNEENKELIVMIKESKGSVKELVLLSEQPEEFNLISISGMINLDLLLKYSEKLNIKELNQLHSVKRNQ